MAAELGAISSVIAIAGAGSKRPMALFEFVSIPGPAAGPGDVTASRLRDIAILRRSKSD
jgi:hypothetical protein